MILGLIEKHTYGGVIFKIFKLKIKNILDKLSILNYEQLKIVLSNKLTLKIYN